jgi:hypothetical protein
VEISTVHTISERRPEDAVDSRLSSRRFHRERLALFGAGGCGLFTYQHKDLYKRIGMSRYLFLALANKSNKEGVFA